jgi:beta-glucosidase
MPGAIRDGHSGDVACDQYRRYEDDVALMSDLGLGAYRFSVSWPRIQPEGQGPANVAGLDHYDRLVDALLARDIAPIVTLFHWDLPQALEDAGGWPARDTAFRFAEYATIVADALGDRIPLWLTVNEPMVAAWLGYGRGTHAPGRSDEAAAWAATHHLLLAHGLGARAIRSATAGDIGIALNLYPCRAASDAEEDVRAAAFADELFNGLYLEPVFRGAYPRTMLERSPALREALADGDLDLIATPIDVLGVNYYTTKTIAATRPPVVMPTELPESAGIYEVTAVGSDTTSTGWAIAPDGLTGMLERIHRTYRPSALMVTENGAAFPDEVQHDGRIHDRERTAYLDEHIRAVRAAIAAGVPVTGYLVWSLLDNFEWAEGYSVRFGLVHVDFGTQRRTPKDSATWYRDQIKRDLDPIPSRPR